MKNMKKVLSVMLVLVMALAAVTGTVSQIPVNPNNDDKIHAAGMISIKPLKTEMTNASFGLSHEHKNADAIMFTPAKNKLIK